MWAGGQGRSAGLPASQWQEECGLSLLGLGPKPGRERHRGSWRAEQHPLRAAKVEQEPGQPHSHVGPRSPLPVPAASGRASQGPAAPRVLHASLKRKCRGVPVNRQHQGDAPQAVVGQPASPGLGSAGEAGGGAAGCCHSPRAGVLSATLPAQRPQRKGRGGGTGNGPRPGRR